MAEGRTRDVKKGALTRIARYMAAVDMSIEQVQDETYILLAFALNGKKTEIKTLLGEMLQHETEDENEIEE